MTTIATGDTHFSANQRDEYRWLFLEKTLPAIIERERASRVVILGDLTDQKEGHGARLVNRLVDAVAALAEEVEVIVLKGNHDYRSEDVPFFRFLSHLPNVSWVNEPEVLDLEGLGQCLLLPHTASPGGHDWHMWADKKVDWYFCHQTFGGADFGGGHKAEGRGPAAFFPRGARVLSGDVHVPQQLGPVTYVGAPYTINFGDDYEPRVAVLSGTKMRFAPVPGPQKRLVRMVFNAKPSPMFLSPHGGTPGDVVKIRADLPESSDLSRADIRRQAREWTDAEGVHLHEVQILAPAESRASPALRERSRPADADLVKQYAKKHGADKVTLAAGMKITEEVT